MELGQAAGDRGRVARRNDEAIDAVAHDVGRPVGRDDDRQAARHGLEHDERHAFDERRKDEHVRRPVEPREFRPGLVRDVPEQVRMRRERPRIAHAAADQRELRPGPRELAVALEQVGQALALRELAGVDRLEAAGLAPCDVVVRRRAERGQVDAVRNHLHALARNALGDEAVGGVGRTHPHRVGHPDLLVEPLFVAGRPVVEIGPGGGERRLALDLLEPLAAPHAVVCDRVVEHRPSVAAGALGVEGGEGEALVGDDAIGFAGKARGGLGHGLAQRLDQGIRPAPPQVVRQHAQAHRRRGQHVGQHARFAGQARQRVVGHQAPAEGRSVGGAGERRRRQRAFPPAPLVRIGANVSGKPARMRQRERQVVEFRCVEVHDQRTGGGKGGHRKIIGTVCDPRLLAGRRLPASFDG